MTYTYAVLDVSRATFEEVARLLNAAGYHHAFDRDVIDMHGIALRTRQERSDAQETGTARGEGVGVLRDGAVRRGGAGAAAGDGGGADAGAQGGGEGRQEGAERAAGGGGGDTFRGEQHYNWDGNDWPGGPSEPEAEAPSGSPDDGGEPSGRWDDDGGPSGTD